MDCGSDNLSVGIMCILRIIETQKGDIDTSERWVIAQLNVGIVCACLPTLGPVMPKNAAFAVTLQYLKTSLRRGSRPSGSNKSQASSGPCSDPSMSNKRNRYRNISETAIDESHLTEAIGGDGLFDSNKDYPLNRIVVRKDFDVV